jgi:phage baseplate assembly protein W
MSFDLALSKGDISIGADGDLRQFRNSSKLVQDILKILHTPIGGNPFFPQIGNALTSENIGEVVNRQFMEARATAAVTQALQLYQSIQRRQELNQVVTPEEKVEGISEVVVEQDSVDPRQYNIKISIVTGAQTVVELPSFSLSTMAGYT